MSDFSETPTPVQARKTMGLRHVVVRHPNPGVVGYASLDRRMGKVEGDWLPKKRWVQDMVDVANENAP